MRSSTTLLAALLIAQTAGAQTRTVTFEVDVPGVLAPLDTVYLAGSFNGWNPGDGQGDSPDMGAPLPMAPAGPGRFRLSVDVPAGGAEYKYTLGSWRSVEKTAATGERGNRALAPDVASVRDTVAAWAVPSVALGTWRADDLAEPQQAVFLPWLRAHEDALADTLDAAGVDALLADLEATWAAAAVAAGYPALPLLPGYVEPLAYGPSADGLREQRVLLAHVFPRQIALLDAFEHEPVVSARVRAFGSMLWHLAHLPLTYRLDSATVRLLTDATSRLAGLLDVYCAAATADFPEAAAGACAPRAEVGDYATLWHLEVAAADGRTAEATAGYEQAVRRGLATYADPGLVRLLAQRHATRAGGEDRLLVLDALLTATSDRFTDLDSLRAWYGEADPVGGLARFERGLAERPVFRLDVMAGAPRLAGQMPDVVARAPFSLDALAGRLVLLDVWATWCGPCLAEIPSLNGLHAALVGRDDVAFVSVLADARTGGLLPADAEAFVAERGVTYPALYDLAGEDEALAAALGVTGYPSKFLVYPDGSVRAVPLDVPWRDALALATAELGLPPVAE